MDLSIIIPCHNLEKYITPLLSTLSNQKFDCSAELIFVCDNCTDNTEQVILDWRNKLSQYEFYVIKDICGSCGQARNVGLQGAQGKYIWFVDGDDWILGEFAIDLLFKTMEGNNLSLLRFGYLSIYDSEWDWMMVWQYWYRRDLIGDTRFPEIQPCEDNDFTEEILKKVGGQVPHINTKFYFYNYMRVGSNMYQYMTRNGVITQ